MARIVNRRRFLGMAALAAASGTVIACGGAAPPTPAPKAEAPKPAAPAATAAPIVVQAAPPTAAPAAPAAAATAAPAAAAAAPAAGKYKESPDLAQLVKDGKLPAVEKRLPDNPRVLKPLEETGQYGGVWHRAWKGLADQLAVGKLLEERLIEWDAPDTNTLRLVPNVVEKWEQSKDATEFTFFLRKGIKWSDGVEMTTDDVKFWHEDIQLNKDLTAAPSFLVRVKVGNDWKMADLTIVDKYTWKVKYATPNPLLPMSIAKNGGNPTGIGPIPGFFAPSHYYKTIHPKYAKKEDLDKMAADRKLATWVDLWGKGGTMDGPLGHFVSNPEQPTVTAWKAATLSSADPIKFVRNPYYWQVDDQGNQLPYIDSIEHAFFENVEVLKTWIAQGKIDLQNRSIGGAAAYTFYKENEAKGGYRVLNWRSASTEAYFPNQSTKDPVLRELFGKPEFREALNISIDRKQIADVVFNGLVKARQYSPVKGSPEYDEGMESRWTALDLKKANDLLDGLGLKKGADGVRVRPDGKPLEFTIEHQTPPGDAANDMHELVRKAWNSIGIKASVKALTRELYTEHYRAGEIEVGQWGWDRASVNKADPGRWLGTIDDGPWAATWGHWYNGDPWAKEEPPKEHMIRKIWDLWEKTRTEPDEAKSNAYFMDIIKLHRDAPVAIGVIGESVSPWVVKNNMRNVKAGYINDDTLRDYGLINPQQFTFKK